MQGDKRGHEVDFVLPRRGPTPTVVECKWSADAFDPTGLKAFRYQYPEGDNLVVAHDVDHGFTRTHGGVKVRFEGLAGFIARLDHPAACNAARHPDAIRFSALTPSQYRATLSYK